MTIDHPSPYSRSQLHSLVQLVCEPVQSALELVRLGAVVLQQVVRGRQLLDHFLDVSSSQGERRARLGRQRTD